MDPVVGADGVARCPWGAEPPDLREYHDQEWGRPVLAGLDPTEADRVAFERLSLEAFQSGLSWLIVLRRRPTMRAAFAGFDPRAVADFDDADVARLLDDPGIIRNRAKVVATIGNARALLALQAERGSGALAARVLAAAPEAVRAPLTLADVPAQTLESQDLASDLRRAGWRFVGPTTCYAALQALGIVDDHLVGCHARRGPAGARTAHGGG